MDKKEQVYDIIAGAVDAGLISAERYNSYLGMLEEDSKFRLYYFQLLATVFQYYFLSLLKYKVVVMIKKYLCSVFLALLLIAAIWLFIRVVKSDAIGLMGNSDVESLADTESPYPYSCYQSMGYCSGSGAGLSWKCIMTTSGDYCARWYCKECN